MENAYKSFKNNNNNTIYFSPSQQLKLTDSDKMLKTCSCCHKNLRYSENTFSDFYNKEFKKAKYQGFFDPGSYGNKSIFIENSISNNGSQKNLTKKNQLFKSVDLLNKKLLVENEGKNLLIIESESQYPLISYKRRINILLFP